VIGVVVGTAAVLALAGVFSGGAEEEATERAVPSAEDGGRQPSGDSGPELSTVRIGGRPTAVAAGQGGVWVADSFSRRAAALESEAADAKPTTFRLGGPASDVTVDERGAWYALPEQHAVERRELSDPGAAGETVDLKGFPSVVSSGESAVWALSGRSVERIDPESLDAGEEIDVGDFASSLAVGEGGLWVVAGNREVVRLDLVSGETDGEPVEVPEAFGVATGEGAVWVVSASGEVTRIEPDSLAATTSPAPVRGALDVAAGHGSVWVTSSNRTVTRLDPESLEPLGEQLRVGDEPASVSVGTDAVWVANGGDGTLTRIRP